MYFVFEYSQQRKQWKTYVTAGGWMISDQWFMYFFTSLASRFNGFTDCLGDWIPFQYADEVGGRSQAAPPLAPQWGCQMRTNMFNSSFYRSFKRLVVLQLWTGWLCLPTQSHWIRLIGIKKDAAKPCYSCAREVSVQSTFAVKLLAQKLVTSGSFFWSPKKVFLDIHMMPARNQMIFKKVYFWQDFDSERRKNIGEKCSRIRAAPFNCIHRSITIQPAIHWKT